MASENVAEEIDELKSKIALLEGDRKAYYESSQWNIKQNKEQISQKRKENNELRKKLKDSLAADDHVINEAFQNNVVIRASMKNKTGDQAIARMDGMVSDQQKFLNKKRHERERLERRVKELETMLEGMKRDADCIAQKDAAESEEVEKQRSVENRLDKANLKLQEAEHIARTYQQIRAKLEEEAKSYPNRINALEREIRKTKAEVEDLRQVHRDAVSSKETAQKELRKHEDQIYSDKKRRDVELQQLRKEAEDRRQAQERMERRITRNDAPFGEQPETNTEKRGDDTERDKTTSYDEAFQKIKEATGVADIKEVVQRFQSQGETRQHLEELKKENEKQIEKLKADKARLQDEYESKKYTGEAKLSQGERMLEKFRSFVQTEEDELHETDRRLQRNTNMLSDIRSGVEHLHEKLQHIKTAKGGVAGAKINPGSDEYVLDLLSICEEKLIKLMDELVNEKEEELRKEMMEEDFHVALEGKLPSYNTRIHLADARQDQLYAEDEDDQDDAGADIMSRAHMKKLANELIEQKTKRKTQTKKKKKK